MIELLDHRSAGIAERIYEVFQLSYAVEAKLVGSDDFPPLQRSRGHIQASASQFLGERMEKKLVSVIEYSLRGDELYIDSLVVHPDFFRRGLAGSILQHLLASISWRYAEVETAAANSPAIFLYEKQGFTLSEQWLTEDGIEKVRLMRERVLGEDGD